MYYGLHLMYYGLQLMSVIQLLKVSLTSENAQTCIQIIYFFIRVYFLSLIQLLEILKKYI